MHVLLGSWALFTYVGEKLNRKPKDLDFLGTQQELESWLTENREKYSVSAIDRTENKVVLTGPMMIEWELVRGDRSSALIHSLVNQDGIPTELGMLPTLDMLYTLKRSHRFVKDSPHFWKTVHDYHLLKKLGAHTRDEYLEMLRLREKEQYRHHLPKLNRTKDQFFADDTIQYVYDHDSIHRSVALYDHPAYLSYMKEGAEVQTERRKFEAQPRHIQLAGVVEEAAVLAIERSLVPHPGVKSPREAWLFALSKVLSSITGGWFREFGYENVLDVIPLYPERYWEKFQEDIGTGLVLPFTGKRY